MPSPSGPAAPATSFILCADDYALAPGVSRAIVDLIERGRLGATSCMTVCRFWPEHAAWVKPLAERADIGLHLTLTDHAPLGVLPGLAPEGRLPPLGRLMRLALAGRLDRGEIRAEIRRQVDAFTQAFGAPPAFIDGHQHVHVLPAVREAVVEVLEELDRDGPVYVRDCHESRRAILKRGIAVPKTLLISHLGRRLHRLALQHRIPANTSFRGVYDFSGRLPVDALMAAFTADLTGRTLIMCHPGVVDDDLRRADPLTTPREAEYDYLRGDRFTALLDRRGLNVARFGQHA